MTVSLLSMLICFLPQHQGRVCEVSLAALCVSVAVCSLGCPGGRPPAPPAPGTAPGSPPHCDGGTAAAVHSGSPPADGNRQGTI